MKIIQSFWTGNKNSLTDSYGWLLPIFNYLSWIISCNQLRRYYEDVTLVKDVKYFKADRMSCNSYRANYSRLFLYAAAFVVANTMKHKLFNGTAIENFTMDSFIKRIMLSAVYVVEKKTFVHVSFTPHHRHLEELSVALERLTA